MKFVLLLGRILFSIIFLLAIIGHFTKPYIQFAASFGVPAPEVLVPLSGIIAFLGGLSILLGYHAHIGGWLIVIFLIPVTLMMHRFWDATDPAFAELQTISFMKNTALLGAALIIAYFGAGPLSIDHYHSHKSHK
jgi:putative oxidoreductase